MTEIGHSVTKEQLSALVEKMDGADAKNSLKRLIQKHPVDAHLQMNLSPQLVGPIYLRSMSMQESDTISIDELRSLIRNVLKGYKSGTSARLVAETFMNSMLKESGILLSFRSSKGFIDKEVERRLGQYAELSGRRVFIEPNQHYLTQGTLREIAEPIISDLTDKFSRYGRSSPLHLEKDEKTTLVTQLDNFLEGKMSKAEYWRDTRIHKAEGENYPLAQLRQKDPFKPKKFTSGDRGYNAEMLGSAYNYMLNSGGSNGYHQAVSRFFIEFLDEVIAREKAIAPSGRG